MAALGYPFATLTPSYAAAIGASGDRPAALAQLIGVIANDGNKVPTESLTQLDFAKDTPYETHFQRAAVAPEQQLSPEIAGVVRTLLRDVVTGGTAKRLAQGMTFPNGQTLEVYGKTGTGDQRFNVFAKGGAADRIAQGEPQRYLRVRDGRPLLRHVDRVGA